MKLPKTYEDLENSNFFEENRITEKKVKTQIWLAYKNGVPEAIPEMLKVKDSWEKMELIRWAYEKGVPEAVPEMLKWSVFDDQFNDDFNDDFGNRNPLHSMTLILINFINTNQGKRSDQLAISQKIASFAIGTILFLLIAFLFLNFITWFYTLIF